MKKKLFTAKQQPSIQLAAACLKYLEANGVYLSCRVRLKFTKGMAAVIRKYRADEQKVN